MSRRAHEPRREPPPGRPPVPWGLLAVVGWGFAAAVAGFGVSELGPGIHGPAPLLFGVAALLLLVFALPSTLCWALARSRGRRET